MTFTVVKVTLHDGSSQTFADGVDSNGKFVNLGVQVLAALKAHRAINVAFVSAGVKTELIIPYHAVMSYSVTKTEGEYTRPDDDFCKPIECPTTPICPDDSDDSDDSSVKTVYVFNDKIESQSDLKTIQEIFDYLAQAYDVNGKDVTPKEGYGGILVHTFDAEFGTTWIAMGTDTLDSGVFALANDYICQILPSGIHIINDN